ncbi:hypothetical protein A3C18_02415 [Candidatus Kaiserbacteria bacterium RIFCSPHIGHO2_02_FULL_54_11b]|uniref:DNA primase/polymerase bifunctional N-terminal domain-containing protein n=2 Tax=Candidatus Kaiseribacteriota TaxID=1752734 RepID=A0A1F6CHN9_9BACT|nr:MAG: hypothetical protein A2704_03000 [Candidatus Kaiserbacteria bacterium RIFCSPHIGHO2_01_FULL_54_36b]OGG64004.1 MAG: hypothetical protein A3C18_02415 [Candidatus Kaiserbacteria bacterium RIFCSPHIGHO2_02_FULL_54_11b]
MKETALKYAEMGYSIIPIRAKSKKPLVDWKRYQTERATPEEIEKWFKEWPNMNIGIITGAISGIAVVDVENGGSLEGLPPTVTAKTGGGGWHLYYRHPGHKVGNEVRTRELTDVRGDGGYVVAPPSVSEKGAYEWSVAPWDTPMEAFPAHVFANPKAVPRIDEDLVKVPVGRRNDEATRYAGRVLHFLPPPLWDTAGWGALKEWNETRVEEPLEEKELRDVFESIAKREAEKDPAEGESIAYSGETLTDLYADTFPDNLWLVDGLIPIGGLTMFSGRPKSFKTYIMQNLAMSVVTGIPFLGRFNIPEKGRVLIIDEENPRRLIRDRFRDMGMPETDEIVLLSRKGVRLDKPQSVEAVVDYVNELNPRLIVIDSLTKLHSKNENQSNEMSDVFTAMKKMLADDRAIVLIHHHNKASKQEKRGDGQSIRGSSDIFAELDAYIAVDRKGLTTDVIMTPGALRIAEEPEAFRASLVPDEYGHEIFAYQGEVDEKNEERAAAVAAVRDLFTSPETKQTVQDCIDWTKLPDTDVRVALKILEKNGVLTHDIGPRNKFIYRLADSTGNEKPAETEPAS